MRKPQFKPQPLPASALRTEAAQKIKRLKTRLAEFREYKNLLAIDGLEPDAEDKQRESELIVQLLRLEKGLPAKAKPTERKKKKVRSSR